MMKLLRRCGRELARLRVLAVLAPLLCVCTTAQAANDITGSVRNGSNGRLSIGDQVILLRLDREMKEEARATTDAQGAFVFNVHSEGSYLVRVLHQGVNYDQQCSAGEALSLEVFDAAPEVKGVTGSIEILRAGTNGRLLHVSDMYEIRNESSPPMTQSGERTFEVYLPPRAKIDSVLAAGTGKIGVMISSTSVSGEPGHYTVNFPLRPGATKFAFNYDLPYEGRAAFQTRHVYPLMQLAIMIPPSMKFTSRARAFETLATGNKKYQVEAANQVKKGEGPSFEVSGRGELPPIGDQAKNQAAAAPLADPSPALPGRDRVNSPSPPAKSNFRVEKVQPSAQPLLIILTVLIVGACALIVMRARGTRSSPVARDLRQTKQSQQSAILLKKSEGRAIPTSR